MEARCNSRLLVHHNGARVSEVEELKHHPAGLSEMVSMEVTKQMNEALEKMSEITSEITKEMVNIMKDVASESRVGTANKIRAQENDGKYGCLT